MFTFGLVVLVIGLLCAVIIGVTAYDNKGMQFAAIALLSCVVFGGIEGCGAILNRWEYSDGDRVGTVNKFSQKGLFWQTWEGELLLGGVVSGQNGPVANVWEFSIDRLAEHGESTDALVAEIANAMKAGRRVELHYKEAACAWEWRGGTNRFVQSVKACPLEKQTQ